MLGWGSLVELVANEWAQDIKKYQLPRILKGVGPMYHVTQLGKQAYWDNSTIVLCCSLFSARSGGPVLATSAAVSGRWSCVMGYPARS